MKKYINATNYANRDYMLTDKLYYGTRYKSVKNTIDDGLVITHYDGSDTYWFENADLYPSSAIDLVIKEMGRLFPELELSE